MLKRPECTLLSVSGSRPVRVSLYSWMKWLKMSLGKLFSSGTHCSSTTTSTWPTACMPFVVTHQHFLFTSVTQSRHNLRDIFRREHEFKTVGSPTNSELFLIGFGSIISSVQKSKVHVGSNLHKNHSYLDQN